MGLWTPSGAPCSLQAIPARLVVPNDVVAWRCEAGRGLQVTLTGPNGQTIHLVGRDVGSAGGLAFDEDTARAQAAAQAIWADVLAGTRTHTLDEIIVAGTIVAGAYPKSGDYHAN